MAKFAQEVLKELSEIKARQAEHTVELRVYNEELKEHIKRTKQLEERVRPIEEHITFIRRLAKVVASIVTLALSLAGALGLLK